MSDQASEKAYDLQARLDAFLDSDTDWADFGTYSNGWTLGAGGLRHYRRLRVGLVICEFVLAQPGTTANGTTVLSSANGLPAGFRPPQALWFPMRSDVAASGQGASFQVGSDGHIECWGVGSSTRFDGVFSFMPSGL